MHLLPYVGQVPTAQQLEIQRQQQMHAQQQLQIQQQLEIQRQQAFQQQQIEVQRQQQLQQQQLQQQHIQQQQQYEVQRQQSIEIQRQQVLQERYQQTQQQQMPAYLQRQRSQQQTTQQITQVNGSTQRNEEFKVDTFEYRLLREVEYRQVITRRFPGEPQENLPPAKVQPQIAQKPRNSKLVEGSNAAFSVQLGGGPARVSFMSYSLSPLLLSSLTVREEQARTLSLSLHPPPL